MFFNGNQPSRPDWIAAYAVNSSGELHVPGRSLKGIAYTGTEIDPSTVIKDMDYLLTFPNPAADELHLRFILNTSRDLSYRFYNSAGQLVSESFPGLTMPGEHDITINTSHWDAGLYLMEFCSEGSVTTRKIMISR
jgi:hypothetical protein